MVAAQRDDLPVMSVAEYLAFADEQEIKYEYLAGRVYTMAGTSVRHNTIVANMILSFRCWEKVSGYHSLGFIKKFDGM